MHVQSLVMHRTHIVLKRGLVVPEMYLVKQESKVTNTWNNVEPELDASNNEQRCTINPGQTIEL